MTITVTNPTTGASIEVTTEQALRSIETFASCEECEKVNIDGDFDNDDQWVSEFNRIIGNETLSAYCFS